MRVYNKSARMYQHSYLDDKKELCVINLKPKTDAEIPDDIAKAWLATGEVVEYVAPEDARKAQEEAAEKQAELEAENEKLKAELEKLKKADTKAAKK